MLLGILAILTMLILPLEEVFFLTDVWVRDAGAIFAILELLIVKYVLYLLDSQKKSPKAL